MKKINYYRLYQCGDEDGCNVWTKARTKEEAENNIRDDYYNIDKLELISVKKD